MAILSRLASISFIAATFGLLAACGSASSPSSSPSTSAGSANAASGTSALASPASPDDCDRACQRYVDCASWITRADDETCRSDCRAHLATGEGAGARSFAQCMTALSCDAVRDSLKMNMGPAGECYSRAASGR